jgi:hypothetical protein
MKINQIIVETSTTTGSVATVSKALGATQTRPDVRGLKPVQQLGGKTKGPYANSLTEGAMKELSMDLKELKDEEFKKKYKMTKQEARKELSAKPEPVKEAKLDEEDIILIPGRGRARKSGLVPHGKSRVDHEVEMARSDILATMKNAKALYELLKNRSEEEGLEGWVQEKLIKANDYLNSVKEYYDEKMMQEMTGGVIAGGLAYESMNEGAKVDSLVTDALRIMKGSELTDAVRALKTVLGDRAYNERRGFYNFYVRQIADMYGQQGVTEGAKVDRMVKHIAKSEKKLGKSKDEAENIAWATANKRGMLDNKNKKA